MELEDLRFSFTETESLKLRGKSQAMQIFRFNANKINVDAKIKIFDISEKVKSDLNKLARKLKKKI